MSNSNGKPVPQNVAQVTIITNLESGEMQVQTSVEPRVALQIFGKAVSMIAAKMVEVENKQAASKVVVAPATALRRLPDA